MPRALRPSAPADEFVSLAESRDEPDFGILSAELAAFCQSGLSIVLGSRRPDGRPVAGRGLACLIAPAGLVRMFIRRQLNEPLLDAVAKGGGIAATFTRPETHRSIQIKASQARAAAFLQKEMPALERQCAEFKRELVSVEYSAQFAAAYTGWCETELLVLEFMPEHVFVQTPGPGAGGALRP